MQYPLLYLPVYEATTSRAYSDYHLYIRPDFLYIPLQSIASPDQKQNSDPPPQQTAENSVCCNLAGICTIRWVSIRPHRCCQDPFFFFFGKGVIIKSAVQPRAQRRLFPCNSLMSIIMERTAVHTTSANQQSFSTFYREHLPFNCFFSRRFIILFPRTQKKNIPGRDNVLRYCYADYLAEFTP